MACREVATVDLFRDKNWNIVRYRRWYYLGSLIVIGAGIVSWATQGLNYGIDFTGGALYDFRVEKPFTEPSYVVSQKVRQLLEEKGISQRAQIQVSGRHNLLIRTQTLESEGTRTESRQIQAALQAQYGHVEARSTTLVGPVIGAYLKWMALKGLVVGCLLIMGYVTVRYQFDFAVTGILALLHDALVMVGYFALTRTEVDSSFVAALLTIIGFSINDTVVIFDRVRENLKLQRGTPFEDIVNRSLLQTMMRTLLTSGTVVIVLITLFGFGGATLHHFALAMLVGCTSGVYSTVCIATPLVVDWRKRTGRDLPERARPARPRPAAETQRVLSPGAPAAARRPAVAPSTEGLEAPEGGVETAEPKPAAPARPGRPRPSGKRKKGKKRRF